MTCGEFQRDLQAAIESRDQAALTALATHGESCSADDCRLAWREQRLLSRAVSQWRGTAAAPQLAPRVLDELRETVGAGRPLRGDGWARTAPKRPSTSARSGAFAIGTVAALLILTGFWLSPRDHGEFVAQRSTSAGTFDPSSPTAGGSDRPAIADGANLPPAADRSTAPSPDVGAAYVGLAQEATHFVTDLAMLIVPVRVDGAGDGELSGPHWVDRLGEQIEPVRTGVTDKLGEWFGSPAT